MSPQRAVRIIEQLAEALHAAHAVGLVHRDVKPSNALVTANDFVYLIDFGIAHDTAATKLTRTGAILGSWAYMAPERFDTGTADASADIYALACVLYECLTGAQPLSRGQPQQQFTGHFSPTRLSPARSTPTIPAGFDEVIARGMAKDPGERYPSAHDLAADARRALTASSRNAPSVLDSSRPGTAPAIHDQVPRLSRPPGTRYGPTGDLDPRQLRTQPPIRCPASPTDRRGPAPDRPDRRP